MSLYHCEHLVFGGCDLDYKKTMKKKPIMRIYLVYRTDIPWYDEYQEYVVIASSPKQAKSLCEWGDRAPRPDQIKTQLIKIGKKAEIILSSFNAG